MNLQRLIWASWQSWMASAVALLLIPLGLTKLAAGELEPRPAFEHAVKPLLEEFCYDCHTGEDGEAGISLGRFETGRDFQKHRTIWIKVLRRLQSGEMPPEDATQPTAEDRQRLISWMDAELNNVDCSGPRDPGHVTVRRLNRNEYRNTVRDLLGIDYDPTESFPRDELGFGFDNIGEVLTVSPLLMEKYILAAEQISGRAIVTPESIQEPVVTIDPERWEGGHELGGGWRYLLSEQAVEFTHEFTTAGRYLVRATVSAQQAGDELARMALFCDGRSVKTFTVSADPSDPENFSAQLNIEPGKHRFGVAFVNDYYRPNHPERDERDRNLHLHEISIVGPVDTQFQNLPESHQAIIFRELSPTEWQDEVAWRPVVAELVEALLGRAYRRPPQPEELHQMLEFIEVSRKRGDSFQRSMQLALQAVLVSPNFLFRFETPEAGGNDPYPRIDQHALASRLSYFLWSSMPDDELLSLAGAGTLDRNLETQVNRMLADKKSQELIRNFGTTWLGTRALADVQPDPELFPEFDESLRAAMETEAELFLNEVVREGRSILTLLDADFTYVNSRLAEHYGILEVDNEEFRRVNLPHNRAGGVLTLAGVLTMTSHADRTSPVKRGKWILAQLLGEEPPDPPPGVPELSEEEGAVTGKTIRERMEQHRIDPTCVSCHQSMDPLGFAMEHFDAIGRWRKKDGPFDIDARGELPGGRRFEGADGVQQLLLSQKELFRENLTEKMLTYALGRGLEYFDQCAVAEISAALSSNGDRFSALVTAIVQSDPFLRCRSPQE